MTRLLKHGIWLCLMAIFLLFGAGTAFGHATLEKAVPEPDSRLQNSPTTISLTFNERIEEGAFYIKLFDTSGKQISTDKAKMNAAHNGLDLTLPKLAEGVYLTSYHIVSADGHPIEGSYIFSVGTALPAQQQPLPSEEDAAHQGHGLSLSMSSEQIILFLSRIIFYIALLLVTGWNLCLLIFKSTTTASLSTLRVWGLYLQRVFMLGLIGFMFTHLGELLGGGGLEQFKEIFTQTRVGWSWLLLLGLSLIGFLTLYRNRIWDVLWSLLLLGAKSFNGHAAAFDPIGFTLAADVIHMLVVSLWVAGLLMAIIIRWKHKEESKTFLLAFSKAALASILIAALTGFALVFTYLPDVRYTLYSQWGLVLLLKVALVLLVIPVAFSIRRALKSNKEERIRKWLRTDLSLMLLIVAITGVLTYLAPIPANQPLNWHEMGTDQHMSAKITPNVPGNNKFVVKLWMPEKLGKPKQVLLVLHNEDNPDVAPIEVPIQPYNDPGYNDFPGFLPFSYQAEGPYLPFAGKWMVEIRVMNSQDDEKVYKREIRLF